MMKPIKLILLLAIILQFNDVMGQSDFRPGYYINLNRDTIYGLVDYRGDIRSSKVCEFKKDAISNSEKFEPKDIYAFRFTDGKYYVSKTIKSEGVEIQLFVEFLVDGIADLYYYRDTENFHYLIEKGGGKLLELTNSVDTIEMEGNRVYIEESKKYVGLLKATFADCMEIQKQIDKAKLDHQSLIDITKNYHDYVCDGEKCIIYEKKLPKVKVMFAPVIGLSVSSVKMKINSNTFYEDQNYDNSIDPTIGLLINVSLPRINEKLSLQCGLELSKSYYYSYFKKSSGLSNNYYDNHLHTTLLENSLGVQYTYPKGKLRPTFLLGALLNHYLSIESKIIQETDYNFEVNTREMIEIPFPSFFMGGFAELGCNYKLAKQIVFAKLKYCYTTSLLVNEKTIFNSFNFSLGLYF